MATYGAKTAKPTKCFGNALLPQSSVAAKGHVGTGDGVCLRYCSRVKTKAMDAESLRQAHEEGPSAH